MAVEIRPGLVDVVAGSDTISIDAAHPDITINGVSVSLRQHTESAGAPSGGNNGDTHWNSSASTLHMKAGGSWRQIW